MMMGIRNATANMTTKALVEMAKMKRIVGASGSCSLPKTDAMTMQGSVTPSTKSEKPRSKVSFMTPHLRAR